MKLVSSSQNCIIAAMANKHRCQSFKRELFQTVPIFLREIWTHFIRFTSNQRRIVSREVFELLENALEPLGGQTGGHC